MLISDIQILLVVSQVDGKFTPFEFLATGLKLQGGSMGAIVAAAQAVRKGGTIQLTGIYGTRYNAFPLGDIFHST